MIFWNFNFEIWRLWFCVMATLIAPWRYCVKATLSHCAMALNFPFDISLKLAARTRLSATSLTNTTQTHAAGGRHDRANNKKCRVSFPSISVDFIETLSGRIRVISHLVRCWCLCLEHRPEARVIKCFVHSRNSVHAKNIASTIVELVSSGRISGHIEEVGTLLKIWRKQGGQIERNGHSSSFA